jgi:hypothetical protein
MNDTDTTHTETTGITADASTDTETIATTDLEFDRDGDTDIPSSADRAHPDESDGSPFVCSRCTRPFAHEEWLELHRGLAHADLTTDEREAFTDAYETEEDELRLFRLKALIALIAIYFGFIMTYSIFA